MPPRKPALPLPTDAELDILSALWRLGPATVREVHDSLGKDSTYTTTLKQMQVMLDRGLISRSERFRSHVYEAVQTKVHTRKAIAGDILRRAFDGSAKNLVMGALSANRVSAEELDEIRTLLDDYEKQRGRSR